MPQNTLWESAQTTSAPAPASGEHEGFKCSICTKSFEQRSSRDRHLRRCRQKQITGTIPRKKSCALCTQAKTRCDLKVPACTRCKTKGLQCHYYTPPAHGAPAPAPTASLQPVPTVQTPNTTSPNATINEEISLPTPAPTDDHVEDANEDSNFSSLGVVDWAEISNSLLDWSPMFMPVGGAQTTINSEGLETPSRLETPSSTPQSCESVHHLPVPNLCEPISHNTCSQHGFRTPSQLARLVSVESFTHMRHRLSTETAEMRKSHFNKFNFMNRVLKAYPKMMVAGNMLPPFVHQSSMLPGKITEPLANCKGLVQMYKTMTTENRQFVLKTITQEHERILQQYTSCNDIEMLSILQAAVVYGILRYFEEDPQMDKSVLMQIETVAFNVSLGGLMAKGELDSTRPVWEEWVLAESKRRTLLTLYMLDASWHFSRGLETLTSYEMAELPLPTVRHLWEGMDRTKWEYDYESYLTALNGERLPRMQDAWPPNVSLVEEWYAGMDSFGVTLLALCENCPRKEEHLQVVAARQNMRLELPTAI